VLIIGRGGGSREDLWAFNDERVARAIAACTIPVVSAVGHEIDTTVCDLVSDARAATPSAAAEMVIPTIADMRSVLVASRRRLTGGVQRRADNAARDLRGVARDMKIASVRSVDSRRALISNTAGRLNALSPLATLERGYTIARGAEGETLHSVGQFKTGDVFRLQMRDGSIAATVDEVSEDPIKRLPMGDDR
jgi:exodeoxyribonuclease VII large subunit